MVSPLTSEVLKSRGMCCGNGCLRCPYDPKHTHGTTTLRKKMNIPDKVFDHTVKEILEEEYPDLLIADGFDEAIIGVCHKIGNDLCVAYDIDKCVSVLIDGNPNMSYSEAMEYLEFNTMGAYVGEYTPLFVDDLREL